MSEVIARDTLWYYARDKQRLGPVSFVRLQELIEAGGLLQSDMVLAQGTSKWTQAEAVTGLFPEVAVRALHLPLAQTVGFTVAEASSVPIETGLPSANQESLVSSRQIPLPNIPGYEVLGELGRGAMGVVYKARQVNLKRVVALKMILAGGQAGSEMVARFRAEAESVAKLQHPHIVQIHEIGEHEGRPYFSLEFLEGGSLDRKLSGNPQPPKSAAELVETIARAMQAAHERGIVHRDLKPGNVLLSVEGMPKITDFGLAKQLDVDSGQTQSGAILGTPSYMAPEQASGRSRDIGPASDIYALGAILYEMLTGRAPFKGASVLDTLEQVRSQEPVSPRQLQPQLPRDLDTICLKCLEKTPGKRYSSAAALADDLVRFMNKEPIQARPITAVERVRKWARRRPALAAAYILAMLVLVFGVGGGSATMLWRRAESARDQAVIERAEADEARDKEQKARQDAEGAQQTAVKAGQETERARSAADEARQQAQQARDKLANVLAFHRVELAHRDWLDNNVAGSRRLLNDCPIPLRGWEWGYVHQLCHGDRFALKHAKKVLAVSWSPDGTQLVTASFDGTAKVWNAVTGEELLTFSEHKAEVSSAAWSPDGKRIATAGFDRKLRVWDAATGKQLATGTGHTSHLSSVAWSSDSARIVTGSNDLTAKIWDAASGRELATCTGHKEWVHTVEFSPDDKRVITSAYGDKVRAWDAETGKQLFVLDGGVPALFSPDSKKIVTGDMKGTIKVWDAADAKSFFSFRAHDLQVMDIDFSPDSKRIATAGADTTIKLWDADKGQEIFTLRGPIGLICVKFSPNGKRLAAGYTDGSVRIVDATAPPDAIVLDGGKNQIEFLALHPDGKRLATASLAGTIRLWDIDSRRVLRTLTGHTQMVLGVAFSPDGSQLASVGAKKNNKHVYGASQLSIQHADPIDDKRPGELKIWNLDTGREFFSVLGHGGGILNVAWSPDGKRLATAGSDQIIKLWNAATGEELKTLKGHTKPVNIVAFSPDSTELASGSGDGTVRIWDVSSGRCIHHIKGHLKPEPTRTLVQVTVEKTLADGRKEVEDKVLTFIRETDDVLGLAWSPDGKHVASADDNEHVKLWDAKTGQEVLALEGQGGVAFSPDGKRLAAGSGGGTVLVYELPGGIKAFTLKRQFDTSTKMRNIAWSPDGMALVATAGWGIVKIWPAAPWTKKSK